MNFSEWLKHRKNKKDAKRLINFQEEYYVSSKDVMKTLRAFEREDRRDFWDTLFTSMMLVLYGVIIGIFLFIDFVMHLPIR